MQIRINKEFLAILVLATFFVVAIRGCYYITFVSNFPNEYGRFKDAVQDGKIVIIKRRPILGMEEVWMQNTESGMTYKLYHQPPDTIPFYKIFTDSYSSLTDISGKIICKEGDNPIILNFLNGKK